MVSIRCSDETIATCKTNALAIFIEQTDDISKELKKISEHYGISLKDIIKREAFTGQQGKILALPILDKANVHTLFLVGLGKRDEKKLVVEHLRRALGLLVKALQTKKIDSCAIQLPAASAFGVDAQRLAQEIAITTNMAAYRFQDYITDDERKVIESISLEWLVKTTDKATLQRGINDGITIAESVNKARHWIDLPPSALTPTELADKAQQIAQQYKLGITIFDEKKINELGMGGLAAVSAGSHQDCKFVVLEYKAKKTAPTIALVGKGITFDSGGLSLKPPQYMETMKEDMSGAAAVIVTMQALAQLKPAVNVLGITPLSENLPSGTATKPGDIIRFYNGKTAEVKNTDAEGRLILADALAYAVKHYKPDAIIDIATLTGACAYALGPFYTGLMGKNESLLARCEAAGKLSGDRVWRLPFSDEYNKAIISDVADLCNIGKSNYMAGAITAGFFLSHFVDDTPWVHLDIAGTAFNVPDISYYRAGATGVGVRLFVEMIMNWK